MRNSRVRVLLSATLVLAVIYFVRSRQPVASGPDNSPSFRSDAPSSEGTRRFGWIPSYPGAEIENIRSSQGRGQLSYAYGFVASTKLSNVMNFYETQLRALGFTVVVKDQTKNANGLAGVQLHAENPDRRRIIDVTMVDSTKPGSDAIVEVGVTAQER